MHITKKILYSVFPSLGPNEIVRDSREAETLLNNPVFSRAVNELFIDLSYEETATLKEPGVDRGLANARADELRTQRLLLEELCERIQSKVLTIEELADYLPEEEPSEDIEEK